MSKEHAQNLSRGTGSAPWLLEEYQEGFFSIQYSVSLYILGLVKISETQGYKDYR